MAQTILSVYAGDQLYKYVVLSFRLQVRPNVPSHSYVIRLVGTALGLITALLIWYVGKCTHTTRARGIVNRRT